MNRRPVIFGILAADALLALFALLVFSISGWSVLQDQLRRFWPYIVLLAAGFGTQIGMFIAHRERMQHGSRAVVATSGTASTLAMISCCAHYLAVLIPALGATGFAAVVTRYQVQLFWVGLLFNVLGIAFLARKLRSVKHPEVTSSEHDACHAQQGIRPAWIVALFVLVAGSIWLVTTRTLRPAQSSNTNSDIVRATSSGTKNNNASALGTKTDEQGSMTVAVTPKENADGSWDFDVVIDNHVSDVTQDMVAESSLVSSSGAVLTPTTWNGDPPGGHHRKGTLRFAKLSGNLADYTLVLRNLGGIAERRFSWTEPS